MYKEESTVYFEKKGMENTRKTLELCIENLRGLRETSDERERFLVIPSTTGYSAMMAIELLKELPEIRLIVIGHRYGFREDGKNEIPDEVQKKIVESGHKLFIGTHLFTGLEKAFSELNGGVYPHRLIADTLRIFSQGTKVLFEDMVMATDAGLVPPGRWVVSAGGSSRGLDTAMIVKSVHSSDFFKTHIQKVICIPGGSF
jgi:hypothetical protein